MWSASTEIVNGVSYTPFKMKKGLSKVLTKYYQEQKIQDVVLHTSSRNCCYRALMFGWPLSDRSEGKKVVQPSFECFIVIGNMDTTIFWMLYCDW